MNTRKISDKELDKYFKNILKKPDAVPFDEAAWQGMSKKLAKAPTKSKPAFWIIVARVIGVLAILSLLIIFLINRDVSFFNIDATLPQPAEYIDSSRFSDEQDDRQINQIKQTEYNEASSNDYISSRKANSATETNLSAPDSVKGNQTTALNASAQSGALLKKTDSENFKDPVREKSPPSSKEISQVEAFPEKTNTEHLEDSIQRESPVILKVIPLAEDISGETSIENFEDSVQEKSLPLPKEISQVEAFREEANTEHLEDSIKGESLVIPEEIALAEDISEETSIGSVKDSIQENNPPLPGETSFANLKENETTRIINKEKEADMFPPDNSLQTTGQDSLLVSKFEPRPPVELEYPEALYPVEPPEANPLADDPETDRSPKTDRFRIGVTFAPDLSTVGRLAEFDRAGLNAGLNIEYFFADRFSILSGVILAQKLYKTTDLTEYEVPNGFWNGNLPDQINGDCNVIDIPLNLRYMAIEGKKTKFFVSAGLSSYIMLTERYEYEYGNYSNPYNRDPSEFSNENQHYFGVYNLSFGVSRRVGKNISIEVEPYLKNSFGGVGWGQVHLKSTGALLHFKYNLKTK